MHPDHAVEQPQLCKHGDDEAGDRQRQVEEDEAGEEEKRAEGGDRSQFIDLYRSVILAKARTSGRKGATFISSSLWYWEIYIGRSFYSD